MASIPLLAGPALLLLVMATLPGAETKKEKRAPSPEALRTATVAMGDVHGDLETFRVLLRKAGLIDARGRWSGGSRTLIQTGDVCDRGPGSRAVLDLLMTLEKEAAEAGGRVVVLMGNHEAMNVFGDLRYTTRGEFAAFADEEPPEVRILRREELLGLVRRGSPLLAGKYHRTLAASLNEKTFDDVFPPGFFAHRAAFSPDGRYGKWLLGREAVHEEKRTLFVHGGLGPRFGAWNLDDLNRRIKRDLLEYLDLMTKLEELKVFHRDLGYTELGNLLAAERAARGPRGDLGPIFRKLEALSDGPLLAADGPFWYRGLALGREAALAKHVERLLRVHDVDRIVLGHTTTTSSRIETRFGKRVILIDTGLNQDAFGGRPSALLLTREGGLEVLE